MEIKPIIVAYDSLDKGTDDCPGLDFFFTACAENIISILHDKHLKYNEINGDKLEQKAVNQMIDTLSNSPFIFIGYSHGTDDALLCKIQHNYDSVNDECIFDKSEKYVSTNNLHKFENSFFYTWSCFSGKQLGKNLIDNKCLAFIGYDDSIMAGTGNMDVFIQCANYGIELFLEGENVESCCDKMYENYNRKMKEFAKNGDLFLASFFERSRDALIPLGNKSLKISDLKIK